MHEHTTAREEVINIQEHSHRVLMPLRRGCKIETFRHLFKERFYHVFQEVTPCKGNRKHPCPEVEDESFSRASQMLRNGGCLLVCFHSQRAMSRYFVKMQQKMNPSLEDGFRNPNAYKTGALACVLPGLTDIKPHCQIAVVHQTRSIALF